MPSFSKKSLQQLTTCHQDLQTIFNEVIRHRDCTVIEGFRNQEAQDKAFETGKSKLRWPNGKHNAYPSSAVDVAPCFNGEIDWDKQTQFYYFAGYVKRIADELRAQGKINHDIRYGGDWNMNDDVSDEGWLDLVHYELVL
jgi:peptidoglycan L-alanyl-D-glutamate endopeptidase CwlK